MGAAFAIQVMTGKENNVKKLMDWAFSKSENATKWIKAIHTFSQSTRRLLNSGEIGKEIQRAVMPGYIFLEMNYTVDENNQSAYIPADVWHLIKSVPGVLKQFTHSGQIIGADEFQKMLGLDVEEQVVVAVSSEEVTNTEEEARVNENERNLQEALHKVNTATTAEERAVAEQTFEKAEQQINNMKETAFDVEGDSVRGRLKKMKSTGLLRKIKVLIRGGRECIQIPMSMMGTIILQTERPDKLTPSMFLDRLFMYIRHIGIG